MMKAVFVLVPLVCLVTFFNCASGEFDLDLENGAEEDTLDQFRTQKRYTPRKRLSDDALEQDDNAWNLLTQKRFTPRTAEYLNELDNSLDLFTTDKRFTPRKRMYDDDSWNLFAQKRFTPRKRFLDVTDTQDNIWNEFMESRLKRYTPRKRLSDDAWDFVTEKQFTPRMAKRLLDELSQQDGAVENLLSQSTQKRYTPRKRLSDTLEKQDNTWNQDMLQKEKRYTPR